MKLADQHSEATIDLYEFLITLRGERTTAMVVYGPVLSGKSRFAQDFAQRYQGVYLDVMGKIAECPDLSEQVDIFDVAALKKLIHEHIEDRKDFVLIDDLDFLFPLWSGDLVPFMEMVRTLNNQGRAIAFIFFLQTKPDWENWNLQTNDRRSRVVSFDMIKPI